MEEIAFSDWPGPDLSVSNPWLPAYGFHQPHALLEKEDFLGNPDADLFLQGSAGQHYMYLETIQEETSDDLQSESDRSESRASPVGWLATDSESGSVIRIDTLNLDEIDSESERELACPAKRRRHDVVLTCSDDESNYSLSRSSSLLQFETLEKQCQDISTSSPSILSSFSFDSLENRKHDLSPDSLDDGVPESDYYKSLKVDVPRPKRDALYNARLSDSDSSESAESERTLEKSTSSLKTTRSFENLPRRRSMDNLHKNRISSENLSEDSGYSDHMYNIVKSKSSSNPNLSQKVDAKDDGKKFKVCDVEFSFQNMASNFGSSCQDLTVLDKYDVSPEYRSPLIERFVRNAKWREFASQRTPEIIIERVECDDEDDVDDVRSKYNASSASEPNLPSGIATAEAFCALQNSQNFKQGYFESGVCVSSVPKDLNLAGDFQNVKDWNLELFGNGSSIAAKNCDIGDLANGTVIADDQEVVDEKMAFATYQPSSQDHMDTSDIMENSGNSDNDVNKTSLEERYDYNETNPFKVGVVFPNYDSNVNFMYQNPFDSYNTQYYSQNEFSMFSKQNQHTFSTFKPVTEYRPTYDNCKQDSLSSSDFEYKKEGSYLEVLNNRLDYSDDEHNPCYKDNFQKSTIVDFETGILKTISETSIKSDNFEKLDALFSSTPIATQTRNVVSTPNLYKRGLDTLDSSYLRKSTLSASGASDEDDKLATSMKSFGGSNGSKGVHFCPVVAEVKWNEDANSETTTERDSTCSFASTPEPELAVPPPTPPLRAKSRLPSPSRMLSSSEPELQRNEPSVKPDFEYEYIPLKPRTLSQPDIGGFKRRGSQILKKEPEGTLLVSYVDGDGVKYKHTHLGTIYKSLLPTKAGAAVGGHMYPDGKSAAKKRSERGDAAQGKHRARQMESGSPTPLAAVKKSAPEEKKSNKKLGGFFSRLASFRFSTRSDRKKKKDIATQIVQDGTTKTIEGPPQRVATKEDYIYIPLKGPEKAPSCDKENNNAVPGRDGRDQQVSNGAAEGGGVTATCLSAKPPLPKCPPRVVGASVKRRGGDASARPDNHRSIIDSGLPRPMEPMGLIETDLDTEVTVITGGGGPPAPHVKTRSLVNLGAEAPPRTISLAPQGHPTRPHKSMEFLLDKQNLKVVEPPENELQKGERVMSEHQLRIQRSLQKLTIPDWYKQYHAPREGFLLKNKTPPSRERWTGTSSKTPSLSSLGSHTQSPIILSPTPHSQPFVRWSTSKLNSTASSPCASTRSSFNTKQPNGTISPSSIRSSFSYRQPYLGWRSQERLTRPRTPAERLASTLLSQSQNPGHHHHQQQESPEIQTSIKEVTSAIVHYVSGLKPEDAQPRSSSVSPRGSQKLYWLESSFVGTRPVDTPQTPVTLAECHTSTPPSSLRLELQQTHNGESVHA